MTDGGTDSTAPVDLIAYWGDHAGTAMNIQTIREMVHITDTARHVPITTWEGYSLREQARYKPGARGIMAEFEKEWNTVHNPGDTSYDKGFVWEAEDTSGAPTVFLS